MEKQIIDKTTGISINLYSHPSDQVVVLIHGASEGALRYSNMATKLNERFNVITYNHPGHETGHAVDFTSDQILETTQKVIMYAQANYKRVTFFAHSMGSVIIRNLLIYIREDSKIILSGAPVVSLSDKISSLGAILWLNFLNKQKVNKKLNYLVFDQKSSKIGLSNKSWLSSQQPVVDLFNASKLNNQLFTNQALSSLLELTLDANNKTTYRKLSKFQVLLISGHTDCFTNGGLNYRLITKYAPNAQVKVYPNSYHEVHNDIDKLQMISDINKFIKKERNGKN